MSTTVTGMPAFANVMAMPPPIVPQPMIAARSIGSAGVARGTSGIFVASRSAKKACRCARDWSEARSRSKIRRSAAMPSENGSETAFSTDSTQAYGASKPRARPGHLLAERREDPGPCPGLGDALVESRRAVQRGALGGKLPRPCDRQLYRIAVHDLVDDAQGQRAPGRQELAADDDVERRFHADQPRQALGAAGARHDPQGHLRQAEPGARGGNADVAGERHLEPAACGDAVDGGDHRLARRLHLGEDRG